MAQNGKANGVSGAASRVDESELVAQPCANCGKPMVEKYRPFCSLRCANLDLGNWLNERYVLPGSDDGPGGEGETEDDNGGE